MATTQATPTYVTGSNSPANKTLDLSPMCPPVSASPIAKLAWLVGSRSRAESGLKNGDAYKTIDQTIEVLANRVALDIQASKGKRKSKVSVNRIKRQFKEIAALLTQRIKPSICYTTNNSDWTDIADIFSKRFKHWMNDKLFDRTLKELVQWAMVGAGYLHVTWSKPIPGYMDSDLEVEVLGPDDVLRDQGMDIQRAYVTHVRKQFNLSEAYSRFPQSRGFLKPLRSRVTTRAQDSRKITGWLSPLLQAIGYVSPGVMQPGDSTNAYGFMGTDVEVYYSYILDQTINVGSGPIHSDDLCYDQVNGLKTKNTNWEYQVPVVGQEIQLDQAGHTTLATPDKCLLYPTRRLIIWTDDWIIYDGPSPYWHGRVPIIQLSMDKWPWEQIGYSLAMDNLTVADAVNQILRGVVDTFNLKFNPPLMVNNQEITKKDAMKLDTREPGARIMRSGLLPAQDVITPILDGGYEIPQQTEPVLGSLIQMMDHQIGVADVSSLLELQQAPSADSTERLLQAQGPLATDYAREMERVLTELGYMAGWLFMEFDTAKKRLQILGKDGLSFTDFDYDPMVLLPVDVPGVPNTATPMERGMVFGRQFSFQVVPNSIFEFTDTQDKLFKFQLWRDGRYPIDPWTLGEAWGQHNMGQPKGKTQMERWAEWQEMETTRQAKVQAKAQVLMQYLLTKGQAEMMQDPQVQAMMQLQAMMAGAGGGGGEGGGASSPTGAGAGPGPTQNPNGGRPPSGSEPPRLQAKGSLTNPRNSTVTES